MRPTIGADNPMEADVAVVCDANEVVDAVTTVGGIHCTECD